MRILIISHECDSIDLARRLVQEGNEVRFYCNSSGYERVGMGFGIRKVRDWKRELSWVGKDGLIVFDYTGLGKTQDDLRAQGYSVVGGSAVADRLELDRGYANAVLQNHGLKTVPLHHLKIDGAVQFIKQNQGPWVIKHNGYVDKTLTYVGKLGDGRDVLDILKSYRSECRSVVIQKKVEGVELAVARFFNGKDWLGPIEMTMEHKKLFPGDLGPKTGEMGTLMWLDDNENNLLFQQTLSRLKPFLSKINFKGKFDINCIINENGPIPLEVTPRFGYPAQEMNNAFFRPFFGLFLKAAADGKQHSAKWRKGFGIVVQVAVPPFPYHCINERYNPNGLKIYFADTMTDEDWRHTHFSDVSQRQNKSGEKEYHIASPSGYIMCVTGIGPTVQAAQKKAYSLLKKIVIPKMFYRNDIGLKFIEKEQVLLRKWGYL